MASIGRHLREQMKGRSTREGIQHATAVLREAMATKKVTEDGISLREMAESLIGPNWSFHLHQHNLRIRESVDAVDASGFSAITGQLFVDTFKEKYKLATQVTDKMFTVLPVTNGNLDAQVVPYLSDTKYVDSVTQQGRPYPSTSFEGQYVTLPAPKKYGRIARVTYEMVFSDLTKQAFDTVNSVGKSVGQDIEEDRLRVAFGIVNNYSWNGTTYNTYLTSGGWVNSLTDFTLTDWTSINRIEQLFNKTLDPVTNKPIDIEGYQMLTVPALRYTAKRIVNSTLTASGNITSGAGNQTFADNPLDNNYELLWSKHARRLLVTDGAATFSSEPIADSALIAGDFKKAFCWREVFPMQIVQAPPNSQAEFEQDVVIQVKSNAFGGAGVMDPRYVVRAYNASAT